MFPTRCRLLNKRVQFTVGVRNQTAGSEVNNLLTPSASRPFQDTSVWTPAYALVVKPVENISLYANYIEGLQTPVVVTGNFSNVGTVFPPSTTRQAETGVKIDTGRFTTTLSLFEIEQPSIIAVPGFPQPSQQLNGRQRNRGAELNVFGEITPSISIARWFGADRRQTGQDAQRRHRRKDGDRRSGDHRQHWSRVGYALRA